MPADRQVCVVGTTSDYIDWIRLHHPGEAFFLTDRLHRLQAREAAPDAAEELLCNLADYEDVRRSLRQQITTYGLHLEGIACFDCESLELAALLAKEHGFPYVSPHSIEVCRDKWATKKIWQQQGIRCPLVNQVSSAADIATFMANKAGAYVLKPLSGSGSELVFHCSDMDQGKRCLQIMHGALRNKATHRLYRAGHNGPDTIVIEEYIAGPEFSADFLIDEEGVEIIRLTEKSKASQAPFGTIRGYRLLSSPPAPVSIDKLCGIFAQAARALEISRAICMVDFIISNGEIVLLELTPRPGGDCLPALLRAASGFDILGFSLAFARHQTMQHLPPHDMPPMVGIRLLAHRSGIVKQINAERLERDPRVRDLAIIRSAGHRICLPPEDYDSWLLGHLVFMPAEKPGWVEQGQSMADQLTVEMVS
ncbi:MAG: ATP-grasp domain-containing protein [Deltaproteobacteria bacterium]|nr:ATP-grasp domain-containing protein [Candidatus Anaeroferrophillus wilburensis]MBN2887745.1 ATP-grasp domain-containing protein [Deltaproteobacteria bacterium]